LFFFFAWLGVGKNKPALLPMGSGGGGQCSSPTVFLLPAFLFQESRRDK